MLIRAFITHKKAESFSDCQDRFSINTDTKSIALSDGMSQSIFQKIWAELLVTTYSSKPEWVPNLASVRELAHLWRKKVDEYIENQKINGRNPWRAERSIIDGKSAGATFLGIRFNGLKWNCDVLGDSCLISIRKNRIDKIISSSESYSFDNYPDYYDSNPQKDGKGVLKTEEGELRKDDTLLLVSDPFSDFLSKIRETDKEEELVSNLLSIRDHESFEKLVNEWRDLGMHNDDSTLIIVKEDGLVDFELKNTDSIEDLIKEKLNTELQQSTPSISTPSPLNKLNEKPTKDQEQKKNIHDTASSESILRSEIANIINNHFPQNTDSRRKAQHRQSVQTCIGQILSIFKSHKEIILSFIKNNQK